MQAVILGGGKSYLTKVLAVTLSAFLAIYALPVFAGTQYNLCEEVVNQNSTVDEFCIDLIDFNKESVYNPSTKQIEYTLDFSITGNGTVTNAVITDPLPPGVAFVSATNGGVHDGNNPGIVHWQLGNLTAPTAGLVKVVVTVDPDLVPGTSPAPCSVFNLSRITATFKGQTVGDSGRALDIINQDACVPTTSLSKDGTYSESTGFITYSLNWSVEGAGTAENVKITDTLPDNVSFVSASHFGAFSGGEVEWILGNITAPASGTLTLVVDPAVNVPFDTVLDYSPGVSAEGTIRVLDATENSPVLPNLEGSFPMASVADLKAKDAAFVETQFTGNFDGNPGSETETVDDAGQTFVALGDGGWLSVGPTVSNASILNGPGVDFTLFETANFFGKDPACVSVTTEDNTVYPSAVSLACDGHKAFKFQDVGDSDGNGIAIDLDSLGVPSGARVKAVTVYDILDNHVLGVTGSAGYDLDVVFGQIVGCSFENKAVMESDDFADVTAQDTLIVGDECQDRGGSNPTPKGSISGIVFNDANSDSELSEGESQLSGWTVYIDQNDNGTFDSGELSDVTESPYLINNLADGTYIVRQVLQSGWIQTYPTSAQNSKHVVVISGGNAVTNANFGNAQQTQGSTSGGGASGGAPAPQGTVGGIVTDIPLGGNPGDIAGDNVQLPRTGSGQAILILFLLAIPLAYSARLKLAA